MLLIVVEIMVSFTLVNIIGYERSTPHSTALILPNSKIYILSELNHPSCNRCLKFKKF